MVAYFQVQRNAEEPKRILKVYYVRNAAHANELLVRIKCVHATTARLLSLEEDVLQYTATEIENERNLLGGVRRYSTGNRTVTIPEE